MIDKEKITNQLNDRLAALGQRLDTLDHELREPMSADFEEQASEAEGGETMEALSDAGHAEIAQIRTALNRLKEGTYGVCMTCGAPIGEKRLAALPYATQCIVCASDQAAAG